MRYLFLLSTVGCLYEPNLPCAEDGECPGNVVVDQSGDLPTFSLDEIGEVTPEALHISLVKSCTEMEEAWKIYHLQDPEVPIVYGELPDRAKEEFEPKPLKEGADYEVFFMAKGRPTVVNVAQGPRAGPSEWEARFTLGDPDSVRSSADDRALCP